MDHRAPEARRLAEAHAARDHGVEDELREVLAHLALDVARQACAPVVHGQQHARHGQPRVELALDEAQRVEQAGEALERVVLGLDRNDHAVGRDQRVDRQRAERRRAVQQRVGEAVAHAAPAPRAGAARSPARAGARRWRPPDPGARAGSSGWRWRSATAPPRPSPSRTGRRRRSARGPSRARARRSRWPADRCRRAASRSRPRRCRQRRSRRSSSCRPRPSDSRSRRSCPSCRQASGDSGRSPHLFVRRRSAITFNSRLGSAVCGPFPAGAGNGPA